MIPISDAMRSKTTGPLVYRLFDAGGRLLYVGCTKTRLRTRLTGHRSDKEWWAEIASVAWESFDTHAAALAAEGRAIASENPAYNRTVGELSVEQLERQGAEAGRRSRLAQGLPAQVEDATFYAELARIVVQAEDRAAATPRTAA